MKMVGRELERQKLAQAWARANEGEPQLVVLWGRRRVGKTFLAYEFTRGKRSVFYGATEQAESVELDRLHDAVRRGLPERVTDLAGGGFANWESALRFLVAQSDEEPLVVVLDEVPYLLRSTPGFASIVQAVWDHILPGRKILLVLVGSSIGTMEGLIGGGGALRGRPTLLLRLDPFGILEARRFLPGLPPVPLIEAYAACGGYPLLLKAWDATAGRDANLLRLALSPGGLLLEEAAGILREELPAAGGYSKILAAVGRGRTRFSEIAGEAAQRVEHPLSVLVDGGFLRKALPIGAPRAARPNYELTDPYLGFWFRVLYSDIPSIETGQGKAVLRRIRERWTDHVARVFEELAREHARRLVEEEQLPPDLLIGRWWATKGPACEVDVLGLRNQRAALIGEVKWRERPLGPRVLEALKRKVDYLRKVAPDPLFALWSRSGIDEEARAAGVLGFAAADVTGHA